MEQPRFLFPSSSWLFVWSAAAGPPALCCTQSSASQPRGGLYGTNYSWRVSPGPCEEPGHPAWGAGDVLWPGPLLLLPRRLTLVTALHSSAFLGSFVGEPGSGDPVISNRFPHQPGAEGGVSGMASCPWLRSVLDALQDDTAMMSCVGPWCVAGENLSPGGWLLVSSRACALCLALLLRQGRRDGCEGYKHYGLSLALFVLQVPCCSSAKRGRGVSFTESLEDQGKQTA